MAKKVSGKSGKSSGTTTMITAQSDTFSKGLVKDYDDVYFPESCWSHARNAVNNSTDGNVGVLGNEPSNTLCIPPGAQTTAPYQINGAIHVYDDKWVITSGENGNSEVGLFVANTCSYHTIVNDPCLNFTKYNIVTGEAKQNYDCSFQVYFVDGNNPDRALNIGDIRNAPFDQPWPGVPYITQDVNSGPCEDCKPIYPLQLDCEKIRIAKIVKTPCIELTKSLSGGTLLNGSYFAFVAYALNGERVTDYYPPSNIQSLFNHDNISEGLQLVVNDMETDLYDQFELVIVKFVNQQTVAKRIGLYSTNSRTVEIPEIPDTLQDVPLPSLVVRNAITETSEGIFSVNDYLIRTSPKSRFSFNYQPLANQISAKWVVTEYPADYYFKGGNVNGYMRDEIYAFFIRWVYNTGDTSSSYHIPGRPAYGWETAQPSITNDVINNETAVWQVYNTAFITDPGLSITQDDGGIITAKGRMGYWQSTEIYPDNQPVVWDANNADHPWTAPASYPYPNTNLNSDYDLCGKALRHHKMPADIIFYNSNGSVSYNDASNHIVSNADNSPARIRVLGVEFDNILPPLDNQGNVIPGIVGYEILRSSRQGNKTVIAKGIINNVRSYKEDKDGADEILYQNYPYNSLQPDPSLSTKDIPGGPSDNGQLYPPPSKVFRDIFTFHSPDLQVISPYLASQEVVLYGQRGYANNVDGSFSEVPEHPKHKLITDLAFITAVIVGMAEAMVKTRGRKTRSQQGPKELWLGQYVKGEEVGGGGGGSYTNALTYGSGNINTHMSDINGGDFEGSTPNDWWDTNPIPDSAKFETTAGANVGLYYNNSGAPTDVDDQVQNSNNLLNFWHAAFGIGNNYDVSGFYTALDGNTAYNDSKVKIGFSENLDLEVPGQQMLPSSIAGGYGIVSFMSYWGMGVSNFLQLVYASVKYRQYAYRYLSHGDLTNNTIGNVQIGNYRRKVERSYYLDNLLQTFPAVDNTQVSYRVNNLYRSRSVMFETNSNINDPSLVDNSLTTIGVQFNIDGNSLAGQTANEYDFLNIIKSNFSTTASSYYAGFKIKRPNLYGQIDSVLQVPSGCRTIVKPIDGNFGSCSNTTFLTLTQNDKGKKVPSSIVYGGDVYIGRYSEKNTFFYFRDWLYGQPDGTQFDYGLHYMISYPRYWANFTEYDSMGALGSMVLDLATLSPNSNNWDIPSNNHHLDRRNFGNSGALGGATSGAFNPNFRFGVKNAFFYLFQSGVRDFFVETELNISYRDWGNTNDQRFYDPYRYATVEELFEPSIIKAGNFFKYDMSLGISKTYHDLISWGNVQPISYNPYVAEKCFTYYPNRLIYSLPQNLEAIKDYWQVFLAFNYKDFKSKVISVKPYDQSGVIIFTEKDSPVMTRTVENLELDLGTKINIGDGSLFSQPLQSFSNADSAYQYASTQDPLSVINTPLGLYYIAQSQGKIFGIGQSLEEISTAGLKWWFAKYLPYKLLEDFPDFELVRNPIAGIGCQASFDNKNQIVYFTKRDFKLKIDAPSGLVYDKKDIFNKVINGQVTSITVTLGDPLYFEDASWTVSYDPKAKAFISFHDWHPDLMMPSKMSILTTKGPNIWKHNESTSSYTNFYGVDYPFEVEEVVSNGQTVISIKSMEYILEAYVYSQDGYDRFHVLDYNFNKAIVYNSEQVSGELRLNLHPKNNPALAMQYPTYTPTYVDILYSKEENKYRFNQFVDLTRDRGEYTGFVTQMWDTQANGYISLLNPNNINYSKPAFQRKKFRHYVNRLRLIRENAPGQNNTKMLYKINNMKETLSPR